MQKQAGRRKPPQPEREDIVFVTEYTHYRTGKLMRAKDYGHEAWPIRRKKKR